MRGGAPFTMDFVLVDVGQELVEQTVGPFEFVDAVGGQQWGQAFLPAVMAALDFAFGLRRWRIAQMDAVEVKGLAQLGEGFRVMRVEKGVEVHIEGQRQAVGFEDAGQEIKMGQKRFTWVEARAGVVTGGIVQNIEQGLFVGIVGQPGVWAGVILPEGTVVAGLPAFDRFGRGFVAGVGSQFVFDGPASDAGTVGLEVEAAVKFAGTGAVRRWGLGGKEFFEQASDLRRPSRLMIAARKPWRPGLVTALGTRPKIFGVEFVKSGGGQAEFPGGGFGGKFIRPMAGQQMADDGCGQAFKKL